MSTTVAGPPVGIEAGQPIVYDHPIEQAGTLESVESWRPTLGQAGTMLVLGTIAAVDYFYGRPRGYTEHMPRLEKGFMESIDHLAVGAVAGFITYKYAQTRQKVVENITPIAREKVLKYAVIGATALDGVAEAGQAIFKSSAEKLFYKPPNWPETGKDWLFTLAGAGIIFGQKAARDWWKRRREQANQDDKPSWRARLSFSSSTRSAPE